MIQKLKNLWKNSFIFKIINSCVNNHFRKRLTNDNFTIFSPNCVAGVIYHRMGKQFCSPTINTGFTGDDFCNFLIHMDYYLSQELIDAGVNESNMPLGKIKGNGSIPDITIVFGHYDTFEDGAEKWNKRKKRINKDNMYVVMYDINTIFDKDSINPAFLSEENIQKLESFPCNNKVLFTRNPDNKKPYAFYIKPDYSKPYPNVYLNKNILGMDKFETKFDIVEFLNKKQ